MGKKGNNLQYSREKKAVVAGLSPGHTLSRGGAAYCSASTCLIGSVALIAGTLSSATRGQRE
jgi:hypothetical protein